MAADTCQPLTTFFGLTPNSCTYPFKYRTFHSPYTLPSSVSRKSFICRSYENTRGGGVFFPFWNQPAPSTPAMSESPLNHSFSCLLTSLSPYFLFSKSFPCHTSDNSPVSPVIATLPKTNVSNLFVCHTSEPPAVWSRGTGTRRPFILQNGSQLGEIHATPPSWSKRSASLGNGSRLHGNVRILWSA